MSKQIEFNIRDIADIRNIVSNHTIADNTTASGFIASFLRNNIYWKVFRITEDLRRITRGHYE